MKRYIYFKKVSIFRDVALKDTKKRYGLIIMSICVESRAPTRLPRAHKFNRPMLSLKTNSLKCDINGHINYAPGVVKGVKGQVIYRVNTNHSSFHHWKVSNSFELPFSNFSLHKMVHVCLTLFIKFLNSQFYFIFGVRSSTFDMFLNSSHFYIKCNFSFEHRVMYLLTWLLNIVKCIMAFRKKTWS